MYISDFSILGKVTEWRCFVTYLSNDRRITIHSSTWSVDKTKQKKIFIVFM